MNYDLQRYIDAHDKYYDIAKAELKNGKKQSHYMWFIFPQIQGLGFSEISKYYAIKNIEEAKAYINNKILKAHMQKLLQILLSLDTNDACNIFGEQDNTKLKSCLTLFKYAEPDNEIYSKLLDKFFDGQEDILTLKIINKN